MVLSVANVEGWSSTTSYPNVAPAWPFLEVAAATALPRRLQTRICLTHLRTGGQVPAAQVHRGPEDAQGAHAGVRHAVHALVAAAELGPSSRIEHCRMGARVAAAAAGLAVLGPMFDRCTLKLQLCCVTAAGTDRCLLFARLLLSRTLTRVLFLPLPWGIQAGAPRVPAGRVAPGGLRARNCEGWTGGRGRGRSHRGSGGHCNRGTQPAVVVWRTCQDRLAW